MATVARDQHGEAWVDEYLSYLLAEWEAVPGLAEEWAAWSEYDRLDFALDWPIREDRLAQLERLAREGRLTSPQQRRYRRVLHLVAEHRPLLDGLFREAGLPPSALHEPQPRRRG